MSTYDPHNDYQYREVLGRILNDGDEAVRRGASTMELSANMTKWHMAYPVITLKDRKLSYGFMLSEALWILRGHRDLRSLSRTELIPYSDDGRYMAGAYGPWFLEQRRYVVDKLNEDMSTRQAVMTLWSPSPRESRDIPCTVSLQFLFRKIGLSWYLDCIACMRSSDAWLGLPYDVFSFSMMAWHVFLSLHFRGSARIGCLHIMAGSQHLYAQHIELAGSIRDNDDMKVRELVDTFAPTFNTPEDLECHLETLRNDPEALFK